MKSALLLLLAPFALAAPAAELDERQTTTKSVDALIKAKGKLYFGTCADAGTLGRAANADVIKANFGQLTPENSMKWDATEKANNTFSFGGGDTLVKFAQANNMTVRGHTLVWHSQLAGWVNNVNSKEALTKVIQNHVTNLVTQWKGKIRAWVRIRHVP